MNILETDRYDIMMLESEIKEWERDLLDARSVVLPSGPTPTAVQAAQIAKDKTIADLKAKLDTGRRDLRTMVRDAKDAYAKWVATAATSSTSTSSTAPVTTAPTAPAAVAAPASNKMKIADPERFGGDVESYDAFKLQCLDVLSLRDITNDDKKIRYFGSRMYGMALEWYQMYAKVRTSNLAMAPATPEETERRTREFHYFEQEMDEQFRDPLAVQSYRSKLRRAEQGNMSFPNYITYFENLAIKANMDLDTQTGTFMESLQPEILQTWHPTSIPSTWR
ncbi:hypothetical protein SeMB42_g04126, partial [Synchytrium endobioticum]